MTLRAVGLVLTWLVAVTLPCNSLADIAVIVHPDNEQTLTKTDIYRLFLGKRRYFPDGSKATPLDLIDGAETREEFTREFLHKSSQQLKSYWAYRRFTGKGSAPRQVESDLEVKQLIATSPGHIGYIDSGLVDDSVRVIYQFE